MVKFGTIFWRQASAALLAVITYSMFCGDIAAAVGPLFLFFLILSLQEWVIDEIKGRRKKYAKAYQSGKREPAEAA